MGLISISSAHITPPSYPGIESTRSAPADEATDESNSADEIRKPDTDASHTKGCQAEWDELTREEILELEYLKQRDREVKAHEMAHMMAGGRYVGGVASFQYERGPDGQRYAIGGEVSIDISKVHNDPAATAEKMRAVKKAALAPLEPSSQDRMVAARAGRIEIEMQQALIQLKIEQAEAEYEKNAAPTPEASHGEAPPPAISATSPGNTLHVIG